jgi:DNA-binding LacI/PurR family transcriptional regulator
MGHGVGVVDRFIAEMGYATIQLLMDLIQVKLQESDLVTIPTQLVIRDSCRAI